MKLKDENRSILKLVKSIQENARQAKSVEKSQRKTRDNTSVEQFHLDYKEIKTSVSQSLCVIFDMFQLK